MRHFTRLGFIAALALTTMLFTRCTEDDLTAPIVVLNGLEITFVPLGETYDEEGATATDNEDGNIDIIFIEGSVDTDEVGTYTLTYTAEDEAGNTGSATRTVNVFAENSDYAGTYSVTENCDDGNTYGPYDVTITASGVDENKFLVENFGDFGPSIVVELTISGDLNDQISLDDNEGGADFTGSGELVTGTTTAFSFTLNYDTDDMVNPVLNCDATFTKQ